MNHLDLAHQLSEAGERFVMATVVRCEPPASARAGAKAVIRGDGSMEGWVGGSCAQPLVLREALRALTDGRPRLVRLSPNAGESMSQQPDVVEYLMTCHSGGTLEIFLEPIRPRPHLVILGDTPTARTLAALGDLLGFRVHPVLPSPASDAADTQEPEALSAALLDRLDRPFVVIATMGAADEEPLEIALRGPTAYVALVASPRRAAVLRDYLAERGVTPEQLQKLRAPAGLNLGGQTQEEIALSIMAEIVQVRATLAPTPPARSPSPPPAAIADAIDPICGMSVSPNEIRFVTHHAGSDYYFCCGGCKRKFDADPARYLAPTAQPVKGPA